MKKSTLLLIACLILLIAPCFASSSFPVSSTPSTGIAPDEATVKSALKEFINLTRREKKERIKEAKTEIKAYKAAKKAGDNVSTNQLLLVILAILLPPLAVYLHEGEINSKFWIDLLLWFLFILPGIIYALYVILTK